MRKLIYLLLILFSLSFAGCQYILSLMFLQPSAADEKAPTDKIDHIDYGLTGISIVIYRNNKIYAWEGTEMKNGKSYSYADNSINNFLKRKKDEYGANLQVHIKATKNCSEANTDSILRVMTSAGLLRYALEDASNYETGFVDRLKR